MAETRGGPVTTEQPGVEHDDDFVMNGEAFSLMGQLIEQSSRDLAFTTNSLIDSANEAALKNAEYGLRLIAMIEKISGGRLTWDEHHTVDHIGTMLLQSLEHHAQMLSKSDNENCRLRAERARQVM